MIDIDLPKSYNQVEVRPATRTKPMKLGEPYEVHDMGGYITFAGTASASSTASYTSAPISFTPMNEPAPNYYIEIITGAKNMELAEEIRNK